MNKLKRLYIFILFLCVSPAFADMGDSAPARSNVVQQNGVPPPLLSRVSILAAGQYMGTGGASQLTPVLAARYYPPPHWNDGCWMPDAFEVAGIPPTGVPAAFAQSTINSGGVAYSAQTRSVSEMRVAGVWQFWKTDRFTPELVLGVSLGRFRDEETAGQAPFVPTSQIETAVSQITQIGGTIPLSAWGGVNIGVGYERFSNHFIDNQNNNFNLTVSALTVRAGLEVRL